MIKMFASDLLWKFAPSIFLIFKKHPLLFPVRLFLFCVQNGSSLCYYKEEKLHLDSVVFQITLCFSSFHSISKFFENLYILLTPSGCLPLCFTSCNLAFSPITFLKMFPQRSSLNSRHHQTNLQPSISGEI